MRLLLMFGIGMIFIGLGIYLNQMAWLVIGGILLLLTFIVAAMLAMAAAASLQPKATPIQPAFKLSEVETAQANAIFERVMENYRADKK
jgi:uncharacterized membrane protein SirB2